jgi:hypothetical protein
MGHLEIKSIEIFMDTDGLSFKAFDGKINHDKRHRATAITDFCIFHLKKPILIMHHEKRAFFYPELRSRGSRRIATTRWEHNSSFSATAQAVRR